MRRIEKVSTKILKLQAKSCRELVAYYRFENDHFTGLFGCPLCNVTKIRGAVWCDSCPWTFVRGTLCGVFNERVVQDRVARNPKWCKSSIRRLRAWIVLIEKEMLRRVEKNRLNLVSIQSVSPPRPLFPVFGERKKK